MPAGDLSQIINAGKKFRLFELCVVSNRVFAFVGRFAALVIPNDRSAEMS
jgi:hypothetical protein